MIPIDANTVGVENEAELRTYVGNNTINYIYLVNDITITSGITIYAGKTSLVIDGEYDGVIHVFTDINSTDAANTIGIRGTSSIALTFKNMIINGHNYFGVPYVAPNLWPITDTSGVTVIYESVTYTGPQMTYNRYGLTRYLDCTINITQNGTVPPEEVGEVNRLEIGGRTSITHNSAEDAVFWFNNLAGTSSLTVLSGAALDITSVNSYFMYNLESGITHAPVTYTLQSGSSFRLQANLGICYNQNHYVDSFTINENAVFNYIQTGNNGASASLYLNGTLGVGQGARFYMQAANGTQPLVRFISGAAPVLRVANPLSFALYSPNAAALSSQATTSLSLTGGQVNTWSAARVPIGSAGGFDDLPEYRWFKLNYAQPVVFTGSFTQTTTTATGNMQTADEPHPSDSDLHMHSARVISIGDWPVNVNPVVDDGRPITGSTEPNANLIAEYEIEGTTVSVEDRALDSGAFSIDTPGEVPLGTNVSIWSNIPFLIKRVIVTAVGTGELIIESAPDRIVFRPRPILFGPPILPRTDPEEPVVIADSRVDGTQWELLASVSGDLTAPGGETLTDAMVFVQSDGAAPITLSEVPVRVYTGGPNVATTRVFWPEREGILVRVTQPIRSRVAYITDVYWTLRPI